MFARTGPRMGVRFASGNVFYMNRTFTMRHLQSVASPLSHGFITPLRFSSTAAMSGAVAGMSTVMPSGALDADICVALSSTVSTCALETLKSPALANMPVLAMFANLAKAPYTWGDVALVTMELIGQTAGSIALIDASAA
jgi:hypothetical protein